MTLQADLSKHFLKSLTTSLENLDIKYEVVKVPTNYLLLTSSFLSTNHKHLLIG